MKPYLFLWKLENFEKYDIVIAYFVYFEGGGNVYVPNAHT